VPAPCTRRARSRSSFADAGAAASVLWAWRYHHPTQPDGGRPSRAVLFGWIQRATPSRSRRAPCTRRTMRDGTQDPTRDGTQDPAQQPPRRSPAPRPASRPRWMQHPTPRHPLRWRSASGPPPAAWTRCNPAPSTSSRPQRGALCRRTAAARRDPVPSRPGRLPDPGRRSPRCPPPARRHDRDPARVGRRLLHGRGGLHPRHPARRSPPAHRLAARHPRVRHRRRPRRHRGGQPRGLSRLRRQRAGPGAPGTPLPHPG